MSASNQPHPAYDDYVTQREQLREIRLGTAAERLKQIDWLQPQQWARLDMHEKAVALNTAGRMLAEVYHMPSPPLLVQDLGNPRKQGDYGEGYRFDRGAGAPVGTDYGIRLNAEGVDRLGQKMFGDNPAVALKTYAHEFRHSYQDEQKTRFVKPQFRNIVDDPTEAASWMHRYILPEEGFAAYENQPVEKDSRAFADELVKRVFG